MGFCNQRKYANMSEFDLEVMIKHCQQLNLEHLNKHKQCVKKLDDLFAEQKYRRQSCIKHH